ncbi:MAG: transposase [Solirubrobacterales bacterium]|nr:transposase [Solirubrobacterales bacterium]
MGLAISDQHEGLKHASSRVLACPWQRCTVHFVRDMLCHCRRDQRGLDAAALREVFNADDQAHPRERPGHVLQRLPRSLPRSASCSRPPKRSALLSETNRRMARATPLPLGRIDGIDPRRCPEPDQLARTTTPSKGGCRSQRGLRRERLQRRARRPTPPHPT